MRQLVCGLTIGLAGCVPVSATGDETDGGSSSSSTAAGSETGSSTAATVEPMETTAVEPGSSGGESGESSGDCDDCGGVKAPTLAWTLEVDHTFGDGACLDVVSDGLGGLFASYLGIGFESAYSDVLAVDPSGALVAMGSGAAPDLYVGLAPRGEGLIDWASANGHFGIADQTLTTLDGGTMGGNVDQIRAMARDGSGLHYVVRTTPSFRCAVRTGTDARSDSVPFDCAPNFRPELLEVDGFGNRYYADPSAYRIQRIDPVGLSYGDIDGRWNRVGIDMAVDPEGRAWIVGGLGSEGEDLFGTFIAQHDFALDDVPTFEETDESGLLWTALTMTPQGPVAFGHDDEDRIHARGWGHDGAMLWTWSDDALPTTFLDRAAVDDAGALLVCGTRYDGTQTPIVTDVHRPVLYKFTFEGE